MYTELLLDRFNHLPENLQLKVLDYIESLIDKYFDESKTDSIENEIVNISPELKTLLDERIADYERNPQNVVSWNEVKAKFNKKHGYAI